MDLRKIVSISKPATTVRFACAARSGGGGCRCAAASAASPAACARFLVPLVQVSYAVEDRGEPPFLREEVARLVKVEP